MLRPTILIVYHTPTILGLVMDYYPTVEYSPGVFKCVIVGLEQGKVKRDSFPNN